MKETFDADGDVASLDVLAALCAVGRQGATGQAIFTRDGDRIVFVFEGGVLVGLESPGESSASEVLIRSGKIQRETYEALVIPEGQDRYSVAAASGVISRKEAGWGVKISAIESLGRVLAWPDGSYAFEPLAPEAAGNLRLPVDKWILELFLRSNDRALVMSRIGPTDLPLVKSEAFAAAFSALGLTADADAVVSLVDGKRSVEQIVKKARPEEFAVLKLIAALITLGLVRPSYEAPFPDPLRSEPEAPAEPEAFDTDEVTASIDTGDIAAEPPAFEPAPEVQAEPSAADREPISLPLFALTAPEVPDAAEPLEEGVFPEPTGPRPGRARLWAAALLVVLAAAAAWWLAERRRPAAAPPSEPKKTEQPAAPPPRKPEVSAPDAEPRKAIVVVPPRKAAPAAPARASESAPSRPAGARAPSRPTEWKSAAERGRRAFEHPGAFAYTIQLELACEDSTLAKALGGDPSGRRVWIAPQEFRGRTCYRVLWGKYRTLAKAKEAKASIPAMFLQQGNRPAVIALSGARRKAAGR